jgi:hypothetical protein
MWMSFIYFEIVSVKHDTSEIYQWNMYTIIVKYISEVCNYCTFQSEERQLLVQLALHVKILNIP